MDLWHDFHNGVLLLSVVKYMENVITLEDSIVTASLKMAQGNPGALTTLLEMSKLENGLIAMMHLDDLGIRGYKIWLGFKDFCKRDINKFLDCCLNRDKHMIDYINNYPK